MKALVSIVALLLFGVVLWQLLPFFMPMEALEGVAKHYASQGVAENRGANLVTSVIVNYRGLDTLGEVVVLFLSVTGVGFVLRRKGGVVIPKQTPASEIVHTGAGLLLAPVLLFGAYIFTHGHLTPGGGFQGGAVVASAALLLLMANRDRHLPHGLLSWVESLSGLAYVFVGLLGLIGVGSFLANNEAWLGTWNQLFSAGVIPIIYTLIGLKVGAELASLLDLMTHAGTHER